MILSCQRTKNYSNSDRMSSEKVLNIIILSLLLFASCNGNAENDEFNSVIEEKFYTASVFANIDGLTTGVNHSAQGFAAYNNTGFCFYDGGYCQTINLLEETTNALFRLPDGVANPKNHCGVACFSDVFLNSNDIYPLLYLSSYKELKCYVLRLTKTTAELVQEIQMKDEDGEIASVYAFMPDKDRLVMKSSKPQKQDGRYKYLWKVAKRPPIEVGGKVFLTKEDVTGAFYVDSSDEYNGGFCRNNRIYQIAGYHGYGTKKLYIIDYIEKRILKEVVWEEPFLYQEEHEQCCPYGEDGMLINYNGADYISHIKFN